LIIYLAMGWACSFDYASLKAALPDTGIQLLVAGGLAYCVGVVFYILGKLQKLDHAHGIWHFFILMGSTICHFTSIIGYVR
jgi:hemolysin III